MEIVMTEQGTLKVFELAKELGIGSFELVDKLKSLNIQVKNHMSDLRTEEIVQARTALKKPAEGGKKTTAKKPAVRAKKAAPADGETAAPAAKATKAKAKKVAEPVEEPAEKKTSSPVIRRRTA